jgi:hypothetical protein
MGTLLDWLRGRGREEQPAAPSEEDEIHAEYVKALRAQREALWRVRRLAERSAALGRDELRALTELTDIMDGPDETPP